MEFDFEFTKMEAEEKMENAVNNYQLNLSKISTGRANPKILESINIDYYGELTPLGSMSQISVPEPRQLLIKPFDQSTNKLIIGAINSSSLGLHASDEGDKCRITLPEMTSDRRKELVKSLSSYTEQAKVKVRAARQEANKAINGEDNISEDIEKRYHDDVQNITDKFISKVDILTKEKEKELMTI